MIAALVTGILHALLYAAMTIGLGAWLVMDERVTGVGTHP